MATSDDKRRHRRFSVDVMEISGNAVFANEVVIRDISVTGASIVTERKLEAGMKYPLRIMDDGMDVTVIGTVIWSDIVSEEPSGKSHLRYSAGLQFTDLDQDTVPRLVSFIESNLADKNRQIRVHEMSGCRCNVRYHLDREGAAVLDIGESYRVTQLSFGGMQMESGSSFESGTRLHMGINIGGEMKLEFTGMVTSCISSPEGDEKFLIGIKFLDMSEPDKAKLKQFIKKLYLDDAGF